MKRPDFTPRHIDLDIAYVNQLLGVNLKSSEIKEHLERMRYGVVESGGKLKVKVPSYRADILHPMDLVEDVAISYGYMNFKPQIPKLYSLGRVDPLELYAEEVRDVMVGLQFTEVMTLILSNRRDLFERMNIKEEKAVEAVKPVSVEHSIARPWLLPCLMVVLEKNRNREYPQRIFEVAEIIDSNGREQMKVAAVIAHSKTNYSEIKAAVYGLFSNLNLSGEDEPHTHSSFIDGRYSKNKFGFWGELSPTVLMNFGLEVPVTAFELKLK